VDNHLPNLITLVPLHIPFLPQVDGSLNENRSFCCLFDLGLFDYRFALCVGICGGSCVKRSFFWGKGVSGDLG
jgi:hypothetical protein